MTKDEVVKHEKLVLHSDKDPEDLYDESVVRLVIQRREEERHYAQYR